jgi:uncharacterized YigZ family protein
MTDRTRYRIPARETRVTDEVKGSRFIATAANVPDVEAAKKFVARVKEEFGDATHNCWAWVVGPPGNTARNGSSDDGEPGGTAGLPILKVLLNSGVGDIAVVVTRYFGGVKLGRGGLVRAYGGGAQRVVKDLPLTERVFYAHIEVTADYPAVDAIRRLVADHDGAVTEESFGEAAVLCMKIPEEHLGGFEIKLRDATAGKARIRKMGESQGREK